MNKLFIIVILFIPFCLAAKEKSESFPTEKDLASLAETLYLEPGDIQFIGRCNFNSVTGTRFGKGRPFAGYAGYVAATETNLYLILGNRLKTRKDDILVVPFGEINGVSYNDDQVQLKCGDFIIIIEFKGSASKAQNTNLAQLLSQGGVDLWKPEGYYNLVDTKNSRMAPGYGRPSIFTPSKLDQRREGAEGLLVPVYPKTATYHF